MSSTWTRVLVTMLLVGAAATVLYQQTFREGWYGHLQTDLLIHQDQVKHYLTHHSWEGISFKEYQPGALWFFMLPAFVTPDGTTDFYAYRDATIAVNAILLLLHLWLYYRYGSRGAVIVAALLLVAMGPILLFRFDLIVSLVVVGAWLLFTRRHISLAAALLGVAVATKLYAIVLLPLLLAPSFRQRQPQAAIVAVTSFLLGAFVVVGLYGIFGGTISDVVDSVKTYQIKPVSLDSPLASLMILRWMLHHQTWPIPTDSAHGIHGLGSDVLPVSLTFFNNLWIVPTGLVMLWYWWHARGQRLNHPIIPVLILGVFTLTSKVLNPQYVWWFVSFLPLLPWAHLPRRRQVTLLSIAMASLALTQYIYPLHYSEFLQWFDGTSHNPTLFIIAQVRNVLLVLFVLLLARTTWETTATLSPAPRERTRATLPPARANIPEYRPAM